MVIYGNRFFLSGKAGSRFAGNAPQPFTDAVMDWREVAP
jgi:hypothetical protein